MTQTKKIKVNREKFRKFWTKNQGNSGNLVSKSQPMSPHVTVRMNTRESTIVIDLLITCGFLKRCVLLHKSTISDIQ